MVLLTAPHDVLLERLRPRVTNPLGKDDHERAAVHRDHAEVEPLRRASATMVVDTTRPLEAVVAELEALVSR